MTRDQRMDVLEAVGIVAVVASLAFLAFEIRINTESVKAQTYQVLMGQLNEIRSLPLTSSDLSSAMQKRNSDGWESLSKLDQGILWTREHSIWSIYESAYFAEFRGVLGAEEWTRFEIAICRRYKTSRTPFDPSGPQSMAGVLTPKFYEYVLSACIEI